MGYPEIYIYKVGEEYPEEEVKSMYKMWAGKEGKKQ